MKSTRLMLLLRSLTLSVLLIPIASAQETSAKKDRIRAEVTDVGHAVDGTLVLGVRLYAKASQDMLLIGKEKESLGFNSPKDLLPGELLNKPFSMAGSYLVDTYTGKRIDALQRLPDNPYYGSMSMIATVKRGEWIKLSVAFPKLPPPPDKNGRLQEYKLLLYVPLDTDPLAITLPGDSKN